MRAWLWLLAVLSVSCGGGGPHTNADRGPDTVTLSVVGTSDLHGRIERVAVLGGYVNNLRAARRADGGAVLLVDAGDMFQGTLESNSVEGASVIRAYNALGYDVAAVGNHEFDFGPAGEAVTAESPEQDPRGALEERAREARFPILTANILDARTGERIDWSGMPATATTTAAGISVGFIGASTEETLRTTLASNVADLRMAPLAETIAHEAARLRAEGARVVIVAAHAGGDCEAFDDPNDLSSCDPDDEIFRVARNLPPDAVDMIVAGHTHAAVAHRVAGVPVIQSNASGTHFGRVDLTVDRRTGRVVDATIHPPEPLCESPTAALTNCQTGFYERRPVVFDASVLEAIRADLAHGRELYARRLGVRLTTELAGSDRAESPAANLLADLQLAARPNADLSLINSGGIRVSLPAGELTYGQFFEMFPFDNRFAFVRLSAAELAQVFRRMLESDRGVITPAGIEVVAECRGSELEVTLFRDGEPISPDRELTVVTSDFLATGGDDVFVQLNESDAVRVEDGAPIREVLVELLAERGGSLSADELYDPDRPRMRYPGQRPVRCAP